MNLVTKNTSENLQQLVREIAVIASNRAYHAEKNTYKHFVVHPCEYYLPTIVAYEIFLVLQNKIKFDTDNEQWKSRNENNQEKDCFQNWYMPIYKNSSSALKSFIFFRRLYKQGKKYKETFFSNLGEFVHFWSGAAGTDLRKLAESALKLRKKDTKDWKQAKKDYPYFLYSAPDVNKHKTFEAPPRTLAKMWKNYNKSLTLAFADNEVAFYVQGLQFHDTSFFSVHSKAWKYFKNHGPIRTDPYLNIYLHERNEIDDDCVAFSSGSSGKKRIPPSAIDCSESAHTNLDTNKPVAGDEILEQIALITLRERNETCIWPARNVSGWTMVSILVYDAYLQLARVNEATKWKEKKIKEKESFPREETLWFQNWYYKIYTQYGETKVLKRFFSLWKEYCLKKDANSSIPMNMGEFVHFWSEAANTSLRDLADKSFKWNQEYQKQFSEAQKQFPLFQYSCENCHQFLEMPENKHEIIGVVVGILILILVFTIIGFGIKIRQDRKRIEFMSDQIRKLTLDEIKDFREGHTYANTSEAHDSIQSLPFNEEYEIPKEQLTIDHKKLLGSGNYGIVQYGLLKVKEKHAMAQVEVAVKTLRPNVEVSYFKALLSEIKIMAFIGAHENIVSLLGTVTANIENREVFIALELCANGDLHDHLVKFQHNFLDMWNPKVIHGTTCTFRNENPPQVNFESNAELRTAEYENFAKMSMSTLDLIEWSTQIANGMTYLSRKNVIHGDLATRNVLLTANKVAKISDFGLSRQLIQHSNYLKSPVIPLPWKWLAIECFTQESFSVYSDVWSFGVTLWEIFSLGTAPYLGRTWDQAFLSDLVAGWRLDSPEFGNQEIYALMLDCMKKTPSERLTFSQIKTQLENIKTGLLASSRSEC